MESSCFLLIDENGKEHALFTGDTLFLGDVGRPDLAQKSTSLSQEELAGFLYDSIHTKLLKLPDALTIYPGHGAGSACGKNLSKETIGNLGEQKKTNYALQSSLTKEDFIREVTDGLTPPPAYFPQNVALNQHGYEDIQNVLDNSLVYLTSHEFEEKMQSKDVVILDTRSEMEFINGHIPNSIFIGISGSFAPWVGAILKNVHQKLLVITNKGKEKEVLIRLARVGFDNVLGFLGEGMENWSKEGKIISKIKSIQPIEFSTINSLSTILDVRKTSEFQQGHLAIENLINIPLDQLSENLEDLDENKAYAIHCAGGYRSVVAASILLNNGFTNITNIEGGINAIQKEGYSIVSTITQA
jgi:rhodanese-related sulfurtransferase